MFLVPATDGGNGQRDSNAQPQNRDVPMSAPINFVHARMQRHVDEAQRMYQRVLVAWAGDVLELRRTDRLLPSWKPAPFAEDRHDLGDFEPMNKAA
jgi:hypothetical protein